MPPARTATSPPPAPGARSRGSEASPALAPLPEIGAPAPDFALRADDGATYSLATLAGRRFILYFYPRDNTPGCTTEACDFRDRAAELAALGVQILGVSGDSVASHARFRAKHQLPFPLLADADLRVARAYGAFGEKTSYGRRTAGLIRSTFVVGPDGRIEAVHSPVKVTGHVDAVLAALQKAR